MPGPPPDSLTLEFCTSLDESSTLEWFALFTDDVTGAGGAVGPPQDSYAAAKLAAVLPSAGCELFCKALN